MMGWESSEVVLVGGLEAGWYLFIDLPLQSAISRGWYLEAFD